MTVPVRIDDCLSKRDGHLFVEECDSVELVKEFGSPLFVFSEDQLRRNIRRFKKAFQAGWSDGQVKVMPAAKANWALAMQRIVADEGCGCDVYSAGELRAALEAGSAPEFISVNGVPKDEAHITRAVGVGARLTIDSLEEIDQIEKLANTLNRPIRVRLRVKPTLAGFSDHSEFMAEGLAPTDIVALAYKSGLSFDEVITAGRRLLSIKNVEIVGFHQHHGRHRAATNYWEVQMETFAKEIARVCQALGGFKIQEIDIGGGFAIPRDPFNAATNYTEPLQLAALQTISKALKLLGNDVRYRAMAALVDTLEGKPKQKPAPSIEQYAEVCTRTLRAALIRHGIDTRGLMLQLEPGRSLFGDTGLHLTTVRAIKRMTEPIRWNHIVVDSTEFWFTGGRYEHNLHDYLLANKVDAPFVDKADIVGRSCYGDRLLPLVAVPAVTVGDILAILDTGAYQEVSMSNFNALPRPASVLITGNKATVIRLRETEEDVFRRDLIPDHLKLERPVVPPQDQPSTSRLDRPRF
jgi:diaminopimelate decarboxylase